MEAETNKHCSPSVDCPVRQFARGCFEDVHHEYYPRSDYVTKLEKEFRELPDNKTKMCRAQHNERHATEQPPEKPSVEDMRYAVNAYRVAAVALKGVQVA